MKRTARMIIHGGMVMFLMAAVWLPDSYLQAFAADVQPEGPRLDLISMEPLAMGVVEKTYLYSDQSNELERSVPVHVIETRLDSPYTDLGLLVGKQSRIGERALVNAMISSPGAVAAINGDYFNPKADPVALGAQMQNGQLISSPAELQGMYTFGITKDRKPFIGQFGFEGTLYAPSGVSHPIDGVNKPAYWTEPVKTHSHADAIHMYTSLWGMVQRGNDGVTYPCEAWVEKGIVQKIACTTIPQIPSPDGVIFRAAGTAAKWLKENIKEGDSLQWTYRMLPLQPVDLPRQEEIQTLISGHTLLLRDGMAVPFTREISSIQGNRARTAIGFSEDRNTVFMVVISGNDGLKGVRLQTLQSILARLGVSDALNLDGGTSTQLVTRPLGEVKTRMINDPEFGSARPVVNGLAVYSFPPEGTQLIFKGAAPFLWLGERFQLDQPAYNEYYAPVPLKEGGAWTEAGTINAERLGAFDGLSWTGRQPGTTTLSWSPLAGSVKSNQISVDVAGFDQIQSFELIVRGVEPGQPIATGQTITPVLRGELYSGQERELPLRLMQAACTGAETVPAADGTGLVIGAVKERMISCTYSYEAIRIAWSHPTLQEIEPYNWNQPSVRKGIKAVFDNSKRKITASSKLSRENVADPESVETVLQFSADRVKSVKGKMQTILPGYWTVSMPPFAATAIPEDFQPMTWQFGLRGDGHEQQWKASGQSGTAVKRTDRDESRWQTLRLPAAFSGGKLKPLTINILDIAKPQTALQKPNSVKATAAVSSIRLAGAYRLPVPALFHKTENIGNNQPARLIDNRLFLDIRSLAQDPDMKIDWNAVQKRIGWAYHNRATDWWPERGLIIRQGVKEPYEWRANALIWLGSGSNARPFIAVAVLRDHFGYTFEWQKKSGKLSYARLPEQGNGK